MNLKKYWKGIYE